MALFVMSLFLLLLFSLLVTIALEAYLPLICYQYHPILKPTMETDVHNTNHFPSVQTQA